MHHPTRGLSAAFGDRANDIRRRKSVCLTVVTCLAAIVIQLVMEPPANAVSWTLIAIEFALTCAMPFAPMPTCLAMLALHVLCEVAPVPLIWAPFAVFPLIGYIAYASRRIWWPVLAVIVAALSDVASNIINGTDHAVLWGLSWIMPFGMTALLCRLIRIYADARLKEASLAFEEQRQRDRIEQIEHNQQLATTIHDSVTRELSTVAMLAWKWEHDSQVGDDVRTAMNTIRLEAQSALNHVHDVIDLMSNTGSDRSDDTSGNVPRLQNIVHAEDGAAATLGYDGVSLIRGDDSALSEHPRCPIVSSLVKELYANIIRHAQPGGDAYALVVKITPDAVTISQTNRTDMTGGSTGPLTGVRHGRGLQSHAKAIERIGGTVRSSLEDGQWYFHATIPLNPTTQYSTLPNND